VRELDGLAPIAFPHNSTVTPCEIMELRAPVLFLRKELLPDSGGAGRRRGGVGQVIALRNIGRSPLHLSIIPDKIVCEPPGLNGGQPGKLGEIYLAGERIVRFPALTLEPGAELELRMPGGAGFGPPRERERERVLRDLALGYISEHGARRDYGREPAVADDA